MTAPYDQQTLTTLLQQAIATDDASCAPAIKRAARVLLAELNLRPYVGGAAAAFDRLRGRRELKVHLGCGSDIRPGWVNVDLWADEVPASPHGGDPALFINHDLREGLPMEEGCAAVIYSSHFFEHLDYDVGLKMMRDCHRALRPGGRFRIVLPNLAAIFDAYLRRDAQWLAMLDEFMGEVPFKTLVDYVNYGVYQFGEHKYVYDPEKLEAVLRGIGFRSVTPSRHEDGLDPDAEVRRRFSFYTDATK
jgi:predicted SAM-dependent methyltransferase